MIFGITLKRFKQLEEQGDNVKANLLTKILLTRKSKKKFKTFKILDLKFSEFVDCEMFLENGDFKDFCAIFVNKKFYETIYIHNLELIIEDYVKQRAEIFEHYEYCFNPPQYGEPKEPSNGDELRKEFAEYYGNWVIFMDIICKGDLTKYKDIEKWSVRDFLFWVNYIIGQRIIEQVK